MVALFLAANLFTLDFPPGVRKEHDSVKGRRRGKLRGLQADTFFPDDDPYWNPFGIMERKPCIPFELIREGQKTHSLADPECNTNSCNGGCCRAYNWLLCDEDSSFAYVPCGEFLKLINKVNNGPLPAFINAINLSPSLQ